MEGIRLIDANTLLDSLPSVDLNNDASITKSGAVADMVCLINNTLAIDAEPVRHGWWIEHTYGELKCSACGAVQEDYPHRYNFCPNCGAKMDLEG